jgi:hypothetical protein
MGSTNPYGGVGTDPSGATIGGYGPNGLPTTAPDTPNSQIPTQNMPGIVGSATGSYNPSFKVSQGWYITGAIVVSTLLGNTKLAPFLFGVLGVALLYQINLLVQHQ